MKRRQLPLPVLETRFPAYRQLGRAERSRIPSATLDHLGKDPAEQMDYRSLEWILTDPRGVYFPISTSGADPVESPLNQAQALCNKV
jgi:hypothetical protein